MKKTSMEFLKMNARRDVPIYDGDLADVCDDILKSHEQMLNMLQHIHWHDGKCPARSMAALTRMVGLGKRARRRPARRGITVEERR